MKAAAKEGITVTKYYEEITIDPPLGFVMESTRTHGTVVPFVKYLDRMPDVWGAVLEEIEGGIVECNDPECDICTDD